MVALTGRVVALKVEADGDLHIALQDATATNQGSYELAHPSFGRLISRCGPLKRIVNARNFFKNIINCDPTSLFVWRARLYGNLRILCSQALPNSHVGHGLTRESAR